MEVKRLKEELEDEKKANTIVATKLSDNLDLIRKMEGYVQQLVEVLNKAKLFNKGFTKNPVTATKVIPVLVDFNQKMEEILVDMGGSLRGWKSRDWFHSIKCTTFLSTQRSYLCCKGGRQGLWDKHRLPQSQHNHKLPSRLGRHPRNKKNRLGNWNPNQDRILL